MHPHTLEVNIDLCQQQFPAPVSKLVMFFDVSHVYSNYIKTQMISVGMNHLPQPHVLNAQLPMCRYNGPEDQYTAVAVFNMTGLLKKLTELAEAGRNGTPVQLVMCPDWACMTALPTGPARPPPKPAPAAPW